MSYDDATIPTKSGLRCQSAHPSPTINPSQSGRSATIRARLLGRKTRSQSGYSAKTLRRQFGENYDVKKVRNTSIHPAKIKRANRSGHVRIIKRAKINYSSELKRNA